MTDPAKPRLPQPPRRGGPRGREAIALASRDLEEAKQRSEARNGVDITVPVRPAKLLKALDRWIAAQPDPKPSRPEAIRRLLTAALEPKA